MCICRLRFPASNAHAPYSNLWPALFYNIFPHCLIHVTIFENKKLTEHKMFVLIFSTIFVCDNSRFKKKIARYDKKMYIGFHVNYPLFLTDFNKTSIFSTDFQKIPQILNFMKIHPLGAELFHVDGWAYRRTGIRKLIVTFHNFANMPKN